MYDEIFHSDARPFRATPDSRFYFPYESVETARRTAVRAVERAEGPVMIMGGAGLGKSLLGEMIAGDLCNYVDVVKLHAARLADRRALLQNILFELRLPYRDMTEGELRLSILDRLEPSPDYAVGGILMIVDEAHTLPTKLLEELRLITNFTRSNQPRARLVLIGNLQLEEIFARPELESFNQRLAARCYLAPMNREETTRFVEHQISAAGFQPAEIITSEGMSAVFAASDGVPRLANQIMDHALVLAQTNNQCPVSASLVEEAWADLQQLPLPWKTAADRQSEQCVQQTSGTAVEFGTLDEPESMEAEELNEIANATEGRAEITSNEIEFVELDSVESEVAGQVEPGQVDQYEVEENPVAVDYVSEPNDAASLEDEPGTNFFSAFSTELDDLGFEFDTPAEADLSDEDRVMSRPTVVFEPATAESDASGRKSPEAAHADILPTDSFFNDKPTDEKLIAFEDEQAQFASMGVWEEDAPLSSLLAGSEDSPVFARLASETNPELTEQTTPAIEPITANQADEAPSQSTDSRVQQSGPDEDAPESTDSSRQAAGPQIRPSDLFGDDFDEEMPIVELSIEAVGRYVSDEPEVQDLPGNLPQNLPQPSVSLGPAIETHFEDAIDEPHIQDDATQAEASVQRLSDVLQEPNPAAVPGTAVAGSKFDEIAAEELGAGIAPNGIAQEMPVESPEVEQGTSMVATSESAEDDLRAQELQAIADQIWNSTVSNSPNPMSAASEAEATSLVAPPEDASLVAPPEDDELMDFGQVVETSGFPLNASPWSFDVSAVDVEQEIALHDELEDIVAQLNFAAFTEDVFSVEQIASKSPSPKPQQANAPEDSVRQSESGDIYAMHRGADSSQAGVDPELFSSEYDDDRDLLIVEEDLPKNAAAASPEPTAAAIRTTPYSQLFAKLRK